MQPVGPDLSERPSRTRLIRSHSRCARHLGTVWPCPELPIPGQASCPAPCTETSSALQSGPRNMALLGDTKEQDVRVRPSVLVDSTKPLSKWLDLSACSWPCADTHHVGGRENPPGSSRMCPRARSGWPAPSSRVHSARVPAPSMGPLRWPVLHPQPETSKGMRTGRPLAGDKPFLLRPHLPLTGPPGGDSWRGRRLSWGRPASWLVRV